MADFQLKVTAETQDAEKKLQQVGKVANEATKDRKIKIDVPSIGTVTKNFSDLGKNLETAANDIKKFYGVAKHLPGIGQQIKTYESAIASTAKTTSVLSQNTKAGEIIAHSFEKASSAVGSLIDNLAKVGFALYGIKEVVGVLQTAFGGFFNNTIGREIQLRETILKTQTTLASTNKIFRDGKEIIDPYQKIVSLTGEVAKHIDSIRERSIALAGVTSNDVIEVFGIVASQIGQIGGGLKEAEDMAINFAAALGTFGIPLYQARQEIGSILRADITTDSYLAKALGITNEDIAKAKTQTGGVVKFLEERLAAAVAGQKIAAQGFAGIVSNIKDLYELMGQRFGSQLLDPLLNALAAVFENLFRVKEQLFSIADIAGGALGRVAAIGREVRSRAGLVSLGQIGLQDNSGIKALNNIKDAAQDIVVLIEGAGQRAIGAIAQIIETLKPSVLTVADAFIRLGRVFIEVKIDTFESITRVIANLVTLAVPLLATFTTLFNLYSKFLDLPVVKEFSKLATTMAVLKRAGMDFVTNLYTVGSAIVNVIIPAVGRLGAAFGIVIGGVGAVVLALGKLTLTLAGLTASLAGIPGIATGVAKALLDVAKNLNSTGQSSVKAGKDIDTVAGGFKNLGETAKLAGLNIVKSLGWTLLIQAAVTVAVNAFGEYQKAAEEITRTRRAEQALTRLSEVYRNVGDDADYATKAARDFERQLAQAEYGRVVERLEEIRAKLNDLQYEASSGIQTWGEFWRILGQAANFETDPFGTSSSKDAAKLLAEQIRLRQYQKRYEAEQDKKNLEENIRLQADKRVNLEKEIRDLQRQQQNELFQQRQALAQKEVEIFRAAGELRIFQMEQANKKLLDGEQGASRTALEALNNYLSVRERGELEIEGAKKQLNIELANLEKQISDYRLENERKIAEIRKRAGDYEQKVATYRRQVAGQIAAGEGGGAAEFGRTGRTTLTDPNWAHAHFQTTTGTLADVIKDVIPVVKALTDKGIPVELSDGTRIQAGKGDDYYTQILRNAARQHGHSGDGRSLDFNVPAGTKVPVPLTDVRGPNGRLGVNGILPGTGKTFVGHLTRGSRSGGAASIPPPQAPSIGAVGAPAVEEYQTAVRSLGSALERLRALQKALTNARTKEAFEAIARSVFNPVDLEQYDDRLQEVQLTYLGIANASRDAYDPERSKIAIDRVVQETAARRELMQFTRVVNESTLLSEQEKSRIIADITKRHQTYVTSLRDEEVVQKGILAIQRGSEAILKLRNETSDIYKELEVTRLRNRLEAEGVSPERIAAEEDKLRIRQWLNKEQDRLNLALEQERKRLQELQAARAPATEAEKRRLQDELAKALARIKDLEAQLNQLPKEGQNRAAAADAKADSTQDPVQSLIGRWKRELADTRAMIASLAQSIQSELGSAMSNAVTGVLEGTSTVREAFAQMFRNIGKAFLDMATQMIAKALMLKVLGILFPGAGPAALVQGVDVPIAQMPAGMQFRASGGPVSAGRPYIVGERGPELFTSDRSGSIIPNHALGGVQVGSVNITVENTGDALSPTAQKQIAGQVKGIVLATLADQKRGGGMLR